MHTHSESYDACLPGWPTVYQIIYPRDPQTLYYESRKALFCPLEYSRELAYGGYGFI